MTPETPTPAADVTAALEAELRALLEWALVEKAPLRAQEIRSIRNVLALIPKDGAPKAPAAQSGGEREAMARISEFVEDETPWGYLKGGDIADIKQDIRLILAALRAPDAPPSCGVPAGWKPIGVDTAWIDGRSVVLLAHGMEVTARYCAGRWSEDTPLSPREYDGAVWSCFDDEFQFEIEETGHDPVDWHHGPVTHWRAPLAAAPEPSPDPAPNAAQGLVDVAARLIAWHNGVSNLDDDMGYLNTGGGWTHMARIAADAEAAIAAHRAVSGKGSV